MNADQRDGIVSVVYVYLDELMNDVLKTNTDLEKDSDNGKFLLDSLLANAKWLGASELGDRIISYVRKHSH